MRVSMHMTVLIIRADKLTHIHD